MCKPENDSSSADRKGNWDQFHQAFSNPPASHRTAPLWVWNDLMSEEQMDKLQFSQALVEIWKVIGECNKYIDSTEPWKLGKDPALKDRLANVLYNLAECVRFVAVLITPVMPSTPEKIYEQLGIQDEALKTWDSLKAFGALQEVVVFVPQFVQTC